MSIRNPPPPVGVRPPAPSGPPPLSGHKYKWTKTPPKKEGIFLWKNSFGIETLRVIHGPAKGRHVSHYSGKFCEITDFLEQIEDE